MKKSQVTCVMFTFNQADYISTAVHSILNQTLSNLEVVIVPVVGDSATLEVVNSLCKEDKRIRVMLSNYALITHQMNLGLSDVNTPWVFFSNSDDIWEPEYCERALSLAEKKDAVVIYPNYYMGDNAGRKGPAVTIPQKFDSKALQRGCFITDCSFVNFSVMKKYLPMRIEDGRHRIYSLWKRMAEDEGSRFHFLPDYPAFIYRQRSTSEHIVRSQLYYYPVVSGFSQTLHETYKTFARSDSFSPRQIVYIPDPAHALEVRKNLKYRKVLVHWDSQNYNPKIAKALVGVPFIHLTADESVFSKLSEVIPCTLLTKERGVNWWVWNDAYRGLK